MRMLDMSPSIRLIISSTFFLTSVKQLYMLPVVSKQKTNSIGDPGAGLGGGWARFSVETTAIENLLCGSVNSVSLPPHTTNLECEACRKPVPRKQPASSQA